MGGKHPPGYQTAYQADVRAADKWLRDGTCTCGVRRRQQWQDKFDQLRAARRKAEDMTDWDLMDAECFHHATWHECPYCEATMDAMLDAIPLDALDGDDW